jgi:hypothetical protein
MFPVIGPLSWSNVAYSQYYNRPHLLYPDLIFRRSNDLITVCVHIPHHVFVLFKSTLWIKDVLSGKLAAKRPIVEPRREDKVSWLRAAGSKERTTTLELVVAERLVPTLDDVTASGETIASVLMTIINTICVWGTVRTVTRITKSNGEMPFVASKPNFVKASLRVIKLFQNLSLI